MQLYTVVLLLGESFEVQLLALAVVPPRPIFHRILQRIPGERVVQEFQNACSLDVPTRSNDMIFDGYDYIQFYTLFDANRLNPSICKKTYLCRFGCNKS